MTTPTRPDCQCVRCRAQVYAHSCDIVLVHRATVTCGAAGTTSCCCVFSLQVVQELSSNLIVIEKLQSFQYKDPNMRDHGENVRHRAKQLCELVMDPERVREERKKVMV